MISSEKVGSKFYQNLGNLFYAMAMVDQKVAPKEIDKLRSFIRKYWLDVDMVEDEFGTDAAYQIEIVFDWLVSVKKDPDQCYEAFEEYYGSNQKKFTPFLKMLIIDTAHAIANAFSNLNKSELVLLGKLRLLFSV